MTSLNERVLSRRTGEFLLVLLEQPRAIIAGAAMDDLDPDIGKELRANGSLRPLSVARSIQVIDDDGVTTRDLSWAPGVERYAYFDAVDGWVAPDPEVLMVYRFDSGWWLAWLADQLALENAGKPTELVPDHAWDLGDIRISRKRKAPLLFVRRLYAEDVRSALIAALDRRSGRSGGILLTTTRHALEASTLPGSHRLMAMVDNLTSDAISFRLNLALIQGLFLGRAAEAMGTPPLNLSLECATLTIHGDVLHIRGEVQQSIVKQLVDAFRLGKRLRTADVLEKAQSSADFSPRRSGAVPTGPRCVAICARSRASAGSIFSRTPPFIPPFLRFDLLRSRVICCQHDFETAGADGNVHAAPQSEAAGRALGHLAEDAGALALAAARDRSS